MHISVLFKRFEKVLSDNSPAILTGIGVTGTITTAYLAAKASVKAYRSLYEVQEGAETDYTPREIVERTWQYFVPPITTGAITCGCIIMANRVGTRRAAAMATAYSLSDKAFEEYKEKVQERLGKKDEKAIRDEIAQDQVNRNSKRPVQDPLDTGKSLFYEGYTGRYLYSNVETLKAAQNKVNHQINSHSYASLTDFYNAAGIPPNSISDDLGWNSNKLMELDFSATEYETEDGRTEACMVFNYQVEPIRHFDKVH